MLTETIRTYPIYDSVRVHKKLSVLYVPEDMWRENLLDFCIFILEQYLQCRNARG